jgi:O-Antigen ligase
MLNKLQRLFALDAWTKVTVFLLYGTMFVGKASVYIALVFGALLLLSPRVLWDRWFRSLTERNNVLNEIGWPLLISLTYGFAQVIYGILLGYSVKTAFQILLFNIAPVYLFLGMYVGYRHINMVRSYIRFMAWYVAFYAPLYFLVLHKYQGTGDADSGYSIIGPPGSGSTTLLGLIAYEPHLLGFWFPIFVLTCLTIAAQERADWLGLGLALAVWGYLSKKMGRVFGVFGAIVVVLLIAALVDLKLPPMPGRGGELSARGTLARMAGAVSADLAAKVEDDGAHNAAFYYGTVYWRKRWWAGIRQEVSKDTTSMIFGLGYGYPLAKLTGNAGTVQEGTRSPHSIFYFNLAYSGIVGVVIFFWFQIALLRLLYKVYLVTGQIWGLAYFLYNFIGAFFGNFLESPASIPFYLLLGLGIGPMLLQLELNKHPEYHEELSEQVAEVAY